MAVVTKAASFLLLILFYTCQGFLSQVSRQCKQIHHHRHKSMRLYDTFLYPKRVEDWDHQDVENWLTDMGFGRYSPKFASDYGGIGVDGDRLIYLGTEDQLDHIEYQLSLMGVDNISDQNVLGEVIVELVAASEVTPEFLQCLSGTIPMENRDVNNDNDFDRRSDEENLYDYEI